MALGFLGEGNMYNPKSKNYEKASKVLEENNIKPLELEAKEGLSLINGTQFICALGCEAILRAELIQKQADIIASLSIEAMQGSFKQFDSRIHNQRPHKGQM
jgi:histidine ammonia-lyase